VDGIVCPLCRQNTVGLPHRFRQYLRRGIAKLQRLPDGFQHCGVGQPRGEGIDGQHPPGGHRLGVQSLKNGIGHAVADEIPGYRAIENVFLTIAELLGGVFVIEEGHIQPGSMVGDLHLGQIQALADVAGPGGVHHHGPEAGGGVHLQLVDGGEPGAVLIAPGEMTDQVPEGENIQLGKLLCLGGSYALEYGDGIG